jgi:hypothetical protein
VGRPPLLRRGRVGGKVAALAGLARAIAGDWAAGWTVLFVGACLVALQLGYVAALFAGGRHHRPPLPGGERRDPSGGIVMAQDGRDGAQDNHDVPP